MAKLDVGGNSALTLQEYTAYGLRATTGVHRNEVEGMRVGGANGINDNYFSDFASFSEIAIKAVGHSAAMPVPGTMAQYVSKSGGNAYHGAVYADVQRDDWQAVNIDDAQIARGVTGGPGLNGREVNRLRRFRDFTGDIGGYLEKDRAWWYAAYRDTTVEQRYAWLLDAAATLSAQVATGKFTYNLSPRQKIIGYVQRQSFRQSEYFLAGISQPVQTRDAMPSLTFPVAIWKGEYNASLGDAVYFEARAGSYLSDAVQSFNSTEPRIVDPGANTLRGGSFAAERRINRPQVNGSMSVLKTGWGGSHTFRIGAEYMNDRVDAPHWGYGHPCNCISTLTNGVPTQVQVLLGTNVSSNVLVTAAGFLDDTWRLHPRLTVSLGARLDRYQPGLPAQTGPQGQTFAAIDRVLTFNNWGPRAGLSVDLTGDGRTVVKLHYGKFWLYPGANFTAALNPNPSGWSRTYRWTEDANGNGRWDPGEEGALLSVSGGSGATRLDPRIVNTNVHQATAFLEREVAAGLTVRSGLVLNAKRQPYGTINVSRPLSAYSVPIAVTDPGPDGRLGSADDGAALTAYDLSPEFHGVSPVNVTTNLPDSDSNYYTWEITATRRQTGRWSTLASFTKTWHREAALGMGNDFTPNALINAVRSGSVHDLAGEAAGDRESAVRPPRGAGHPRPVRHAGRTDVRSRAGLWQRDNQSGADRRPAARDGGGGGRANGKGVPHLPPARHGIRRRLQRPEQQCRTDGDDQFRCRVAAAHRDYRAAHCQARRSIRMVATSERHRVSHLGLRWAPALLWLTVAIAAAVPEAVVADDEPKAILLLHSYGHDAPGRVAMDSGFARMLREAEGVKVDLYIETLDPNRFRGEEQAQRTRTYLRERYADKKIAVVAAAYDRALAAVLDPRDPLFPGVPVAAVLTRYPEALPVHVSVIWSGQPIGDSSALALRLHPAARQIALVDGAQPGAPNEAVHGEALRQIQEAAPSVPVVPLRNLPLDELLRRAEALPSDTVILVVRQVLGRGTTSISTADAVKELARVARAPIYVCTDQQIGTGAVGGIVVSVEAEAARLAQLALRLAADGSLRLPPEEGTPVPMFDGRALRRWGIAATLLPPGSIVRFGAAWAVGSVQVLHRRRDHRARTAERADRGTRRSARAATPHRAGAARQRAALTAVLRPESGSRRPPDQRPGSRALTHRARSPRRREPATRRRRDHAERAQTQSRPARAGA